MSDTAVLRELQAQVVRLIQERNNLRAERDGANASALAHIEECYRLTVRVRELEAKLAGHREGRPC